MNSFRGKGRFLRPLLGILLVLFAGCQNAAGGYGSPSYGGSSMGPLPSSGGPPYTVTYYSSYITGGSVPTDPVQYAAGDPVTVKSQGTLLYSPYHFVGWNTLGNGTGTTYQAGDHFQINANTILYAVWQ